MDVIIPTKNSALVLEECLMSLAKQHSPVNIIIVDAHSTDKTRDIARAFNCTIYDEPPSNVKGSRRAVACNEGLRHSESKYVAFLDSDVEVPPAWSTDMESSMKYWDSGIAGDIPSDGATPVAAITSGCVDINSPAHAIMKFGSPNHAKKFITVTQLTSVPGYNSVYRRSAIDDVGMFSEEIGGCEDFELNHRLLKAGYALLGIPDSPVIHKERADINSFAVQIYGYGWSRARLLKTKHIFSAVHILPIIFIVCFIAAFSVFGVLTLTVFSPHAMILVLFAIIMIFVLFPYHSIFALEWSSGYIHGLLD